MNGLKTGFRGFWNALISKTNIHPATGIGFRFLVTTLKGCLTKNQNRAPGFASRMGKSGAGSLSHLKDGSRLRSNDSFHSQSPATLTAFGASLLYAPSTAARDFTANGPLGRKGKEETIQD